MVQNRSALSENIFATPSCPARDLAETQAKIIFMSWHAKRIFTLLVFLTSNDRGAAAIFQHAPPRPRGALISRRYHPRCYTYTKRLRGKSPSPGRIGIGSNSPPSWHVFDRLNPSPSRDDTCNRKAAGHSCYRNNPADARRASRLCNKKYAIHKPAADRLYEAP